MKNQIYFLLFSIIFIIFSCSTEEEIKTEKPYWIKSINCNFENHDDKDILSFKTDSNLTFVTINGELNSSLSRSKSTSIQIDSSHTDPIISLSNLKLGQLIEYSFWQYKGDSSASIKVINQNNRKVYQSNYTQLGKSKKGWKQHFLSIPVSVENTTLEFYVETSDSIAIFDDLELKIYPVMPKNEITESLNLYIPNKSKKKINKYISKALDKKVIPAKSKKYVNAFFIQNEDSCKIKMKLKGDWTDHIKPDKASFRIKISDDKAYMGMTSFSIQHPKTRNFLNEWVLHKIAEENDVLTTKYDFINVTINDYFYGIYAIEEHFDKHIVENRDRREGPILKFDESGTWALKEKIHNQGKNYNFPFFESSTISVFKEKRTLKSPQLTAQYKEALKLVQLFRSGHIQIEDIFDLDQLAKFYVLVELSSNYHALTWHNRRFYFNPITQKLEHVFFDAIPYPETKRDIISEILTNTEKEPNLILDNAILMNTRFKEKFLFYLGQQTEKKYLDSIFSNIEGDLSLYKSAIIGENESYSYTKQELYDHAHFLRSNMKNLDILWEEKLTEIESPFDWMKPQSYGVLTDSIVIPEISINSYVNRLPNGKYEILFENYHLSDIEVLGYISNIENKETFFLTPIKLHAFQKVAYAAKTTVDSYPSKILFVAKNKPTKTYSKITIPWEKPEGTTTRIKLKNKFNILSDHYTVQNNILTFNRNCTIEEIIYIPEEYQVVINEGSRIEFKNGGGIIITNSLTCVGSIKNPISFVCNDNSSKGITVLKGDLVRIKHTTLDGLSNMDYESWSLTGALTIYETETDISDLTIKNNNSEDALNIIRSNFKIDNLFISDTYSDGFDADFCTGSISNSIFINTGNDCIDFSGSNILIENITIKNSGDKGISGGEKSKLELINISIDGAITGIASKDKTQINGTNIFIKNSQFGFSAFQKKPTYGPASIDLNDCKLESTRQQILVELNSTITINSTTYAGKIKLDIEELYKQFNK